jgi:DNA-binding transcriptional ArsR family regulator
MYPHLSFNHMVESNVALDRIFGALADATRRDILKRVSREEYTISELAKPYDMSMAAIAKHISVLEKAGLITKRRSGKEKVIHVTSDTIKVAAAHLSEYEKIWSARFDALEKLLEDQ